MRQTSSLLTCLTVLLAGGSALVAQTLQTGALVGTVKNDQGKPMAGVLVRARSGQIDRTALTNDKGEYRFGLLNLGDWTLMVNASGYQASSAKAYVGINETRTANFKLAAVAGATVAVTATPENLDMTTVQTSTSFNAEALDRLPGDYTSTFALEGILAAVPGVQIVEGNYFQIAGGTGTENLFTVDGNVTNTTRNGNGNNWVSVQPPREFMENVEVVTGGFGAEYNALGGVINQVTKTGSNTWAGEFFAYTNFPNSAALTKFNGNTTPPQTQPSQPDKFYRYGATVSGPLVKDKLFLFLGYQTMVDKIPPTNNGVPNWNGLLAEQSTHTGPETLSFKMNWFPHPDHQLILSMTHTKDQTDTGHQPPFGAPQFGYFLAGTSEAGSTSVSIAQTTNLTWNWTIAPELFLVTSLGRFQDPHHNIPYSPTINDSAANFTDDYRYFVTGPGRNAPNKPAGSQFYAYETGSQGYAVNSTNPNGQARVDLSWAHQNHLVKAGYSQQDSRFENHITGFNAYALYSNFVDYSFIGDPTALEETFFRNGGENTHVHYRSYYLKDEWKAAPGVLLDLGLRVDTTHLVGFTPGFEGTDLGNYNKPGRQLQPRLGVTWDVANDGKTKLYAQFGRYFQTMPLQGANWTSASIYDVSYWLANHYTYNQDYTTGPAFTILIDPATGQPYASDMTFHLGSQGKPGSHVTDLRLPHKDMLTLGGDRVLPGGWTAGATWKYWTLKDPVAQSNFTNANGSNAFPGVVSGTVQWNPHPGPVTFVASDGSTQTYNSPFPDPKDDYLSLNLHARHGGPDHYLALDYTWVHHYGNFRGPSDAYSSLNANFGTRGSVGTNVDPHWQFYQVIDSGNIGADPVHELKASGFYALPLGGQKLVISPVFTWSSGYGLEKTVPVGTLYPNFMGSGSNSVNPDNQMGAGGHTPSTTKLDLNLSMNFKVAKVAIKPTISISNAFNTRLPNGYYVQQVAGSTPGNAHPDPNYGQEENWQPGRAFTAGVSVKF